MSEEKIPQVPIVPVIGVNVDEKPIDIAVQIAEEVAKATAVIQEQFKSEISGLNRKNTELQTTLKTQELEGKTVAEQKELLLQEKIQIEKDIIKLNRGRIIDRELSEAGLPLELSSRIQGSDEANIKADVITLGAYISKLAQDKADGIINKKLAGKPPEDGKTPAKIGLDEQIIQAQKDGDFELSIALKELKRNQK